MGIGNVVAAVGVTIGVWLAGWSFVHGRIVNLQSAMYARLRIGPATFDELCRVASSARPVWRPLAYAALMLLCRQGVIAPRTNPAGSRGRLASVTWVTTASDDVVSPRRLRLIRGNRAS